MNTYTKKTATMSPEEIRAYNAAFEAKRNASAPVRNVYTYNTITSQGVRNALRDNIRQGLQYTAF